MRFVAKMQGWIDKRDKEDRMGQLHAEKAIHGREIAAVQTRIASLEVIGLATEPAAAVVMQPVSVTLSIISGKVARPACQGGHSQTTV